MSRCFPLKAVAEDMEELFPGGAWQQGWSRRSGMDKPGFPEAPQMPSRPKTGGGVGRSRLPRGKAPTALPPWWGEKGGCTRCTGLREEKSTHGVVTVHVHATAGVLATQGGRQALRLTIAPGVVCVLCALFSVIYVLSASWLHQKGGLWRRVGLRFGGWVLIRRRKP